MGQRNSVKLVLRDGTEHEFMDDEFYTFSDSIQNALFTLDLKEESVRSVTVENTDAPWSAGAVGFEG